MKLNNVRLKIIDPKLPENPLPYATPGSAGADLRASISDPLHLTPGSVELVGTGIAVKLNSPNHALMLLPRSGLGHRGLVLGNLVGLIDSDYTGEIKVSLWNRSAETIVVQPYDRIAQLVCVPVVQITNPIIVDEFEETERGENGFNSTGTR